MVTTIEAKQKYWSELSDVQVHSSQTSLKYCGVPGNIMAMQLMVVSFGVPNIRSQLTLNYQ